MAEQSVVTASNTDDLSREFLEQKILQCLSALYESSRLAKDISGEEERLAKFEDIKSQLTRDDQRPLSALENIDGHINGVNANINNLKSTMRESEEKVVQGFHEILTKLLETSEKKSTISSSGYKKALDGFGERISAKFDSNISSLNQRLEVLQANKLDTTAEETLTTRINTVKTTTITTLKKTVDTVTQVNNSRLSSFQNDINKQLKEINYTAIKANVQQEVTESLKNRMQDFVASSQQSVAELKQQPLTDQMKEYVNKEIVNHVGPVNLHKIITTLPEYQTLKQMVVDKQTQLTQLDLEQSAEFQSVKTVMKNMSEELLQLKQKSQSTRQIVEVLQNRGKPVEAVMTTFDHTKTVQHIEQMEREINVMYNSIKMIENVADTTSLDVSPRKRAREEDGEYQAKDEVIAKLEEIEKKQQKLQDFIYQCKDNVLDDDFPTRLDAAMEKIQHILVNHGTFISFLVDPLLTAKRLKASTANVDHVDPAMLTSLTRLIEQTTNEVSQPLLRRIKVLEEKLEASQRN